MQIEATYNNGQIELPAHLQLCRDVFKIRIDIPAEVIVKQPATDLVENADPGVFSIRQQLDDILGAIRDSQSKKMLKVHDYKDMWHSHLERKHLHDRSTTPTLKG